MHSVPGDHHTVHSVPGDHHTVHSVPGDHHTVHSVPGDHHTVHSVPGGPVIWQSFYIRCWFALKRQSVNSNYLCSELTPVLKCLKCMGCWLYKVARLHKSFVGRWSGNTHFCTSSLACVSISFFVYEPLHCSWRSANVPIYDA